MRGVHFISAFLLLLAFVTLAVPAPAFAQVAAANRRSSCKGFCVADVVSDIIHALQPKQMSFP